MTGEIVVVITIFKFKILSQDFVHPLSYQNCNSFYALPFYFACFWISLLLVISLQSEGSLLHTVRPLSGNAENAFFHISFPSLHDYDDVRVPNFTLLGRRDQRKKRTFFFLSSTSKRLISAPENLLTFRELKAMRWNMRDQAARIHFLRYVFVAVAVVVA